jgi:hypothetical protein
LWVNVDASSVAPVQSVFGRTGAVVAAEGDYSLTLLGDVTITTPVSGQTLRYSGTGWVNASSDSLGTALATPSTLMARDATANTAVNKLTAAIYDIDALPALP